MFFGFNMLSQISNSQLGMIMKTDSQKENMVLFSELFNRFSNIGITMLDWENLPPGVDERILNMGLYLQGSCAFFVHPELGLTALPCDKGNTFNLLYQPTSVTVYGYGWSKQIMDPDNFGFVRTSPTGVPLALTVYQYTRRMADTLRSIDVIQQRMKRPYIIKCDEKERLTIYNLFKKVKDNEELILGMKDYPLENRTFEIAPTPYVGDVDRLWNSYNNYLILLYTAMGIKCVDINKRERLVADEAKSNDMVIQITSEVSVKELTLCIDRVNEKFGTNIKVHVREYTDYKDNEGFTYQEPGGDVNG